MKKERYIIQNVLRRKALFAIYDKRKVIYDVQINLIYQYQLTIILYHNIFTHLKNKIYFCFNGRNIYTNLSLLFLQFTYDIKKILKLSSF